jgi:hypothetical protein
LWHRRRALLTKPFKTVDRRPGGPNKPDFGLVGWRCSRLRALQFA